MLAVASLRLYAQRQSPSTAVHVFHPVPHYPQLRLRKPSMPVTSEHNHRTLQRVRDYHRPLARSCCVLSALAWSRHPRFQPEPADHAREVVANRPRSSQTALEVATAEAWPRLSALDNANVAPRLLSPSALSSPSAVSFPLQVLPVLLSLPFSLLSRPSVSRLGVRDA